MSHCVSLLGFVSLVKTGVTSHCSSPSHLPGAATGHSALLLRLCSPYGPRVNHRLLWPLAQQPRTLFHLEIIPLMTVEET